MAKQGRASQEPDEPSEIETVITRGEEAAGERKGRYRQVGLSLATVFAEHSETLSDHDQQIEELWRRLSREREELQQYTDERVLALERALAEARGSAAPTERVRTLEEALSRARDETTRRAKALEDLEARVRDLEHHLDETRQTAATAEALTQLERRVQAELARLKEGAEAHEPMESLKRQVGDLRREMEEQKARQTRVQTLEERFEAARAKVEEERDTVLSERAREIEDLRGRIQKEREALKQDTEHRVAALAQAIDRVREETTQQGRVVQQLEDRVRLETERLDGDAESQRRALDALEVQLVDVRRVVEGQRGLEERLAALENQVKSARSAIAEHDGALNERAHEIEGLRERLATEYHAWEARARERLSQFEQTIDERATAAGPEARIEPAPTGVAETRLASLEREMTVLRERMQQEQPRSVTTTPPASLERFVARSRLILGVGLVLMLAVVGVLAYGAAVAPADLTTFAVIFAIAGGVMAGLAVAVVGLIVLLRDAVRTAR